jgi:hypothetical protein
MPPALRFKDAWLQLYANAGEQNTSPDEQGYTIDGRSNRYCSLIIEPQFFGRADRILYNSGRLQPIHVELVGTKSVGDLVKEGLVTLPANAKCPEYLFPSDHFGVLAEMQVV